MDGLLALQEKALYNIRLAKDTDFESLDVIAGDLNNFSGYSSISPLDATNEVELFQMLLKDGYIVVAEQDKQLVGVIGFIVSKMLGSDSLMMLPVLWWVVPEHRNGVISKELLSTAEQIAKMRGASVSFLSANVNNPKSIHRRYRQLGYAPQEIHFMKEL